MVDTSQILLSDVIGWVETKDCPHAIRFEPVTYQNLINGAILPSHMVILRRIMSVHNCSQGTAEMIYSSSFGKYQEMGFDMYASDGTSEDVITFCGDEAEQDRLFNNFVIAENINFKPSDLAGSVTDRNNFALKYNGSLVYASSIIAALEHFAFDVVS